MLARTSNGGGVALGVGPIDVVALGSTTGVAVSYTHLDVYKRQIKEDEYNISAEYSQFFLNIAFYACLKTYTWYLC